jgi:hypothetical protein
MGLSFTVAAGPRQRSHSQVRAPRDSWPHFNISHSRLSQSGGPGTLVITQEQRGPGTGFPFRRLLEFSALQWRYSNHPQHGPLSIQVKVKVTLRLTVSQSVSLGVEPHLGLMTRYLLLFDSYGLVFCGASFWREDGSVICTCWWPLPAQSFSGPSSLGLAAIFYCLNIDTITVGPPYTWTRTACKTPHPLLLFQFLLPRKGVRPRNGRIYSFSTSALSRHVCVSSRPADYKFAIKNEKGNIGWTNL